jgi:starch-binding outer membrane protein, SusD/RagB family
MRNPTRILAAAALALVGACKDSNVPDLTQPTSVANTPTGIQNVVTGLFYQTRYDVGNYIFATAAFGRDAGNFTNTEPRWITEGLALSPISPTDQFWSTWEWDYEFNNAKLANSILASVPKTAPAYTPAQAAAVDGIVQTIKALNFMMIAETHDSLGVPLYSIDSTTPATPYCNRDVWRYIVALLDSANADLNTAGGIPLPVNLPSGFGAVSAQAGPSTTAGSFAAFNRALAGKAGLELAYAIARQAGAGATPSTMGSPDVAALTRADSAIKASALFAPSAITTPSGSGFSTNDAYGVYHVYSSASGDYVNQVNAEVGTLIVLWDLVADVDTVNDARWKAKFSPIPSQNLPVQQSTFAPVASPYIFSFYPQVSTPIPIVRNEELALVDAQIQIGLGQLGAAITLINTVHMQAGGYATPLAIPSDYVDVRDALLKEQRISTALEASGDRAISIRMYGLAKVADTTWVATQGPDAAGVASVTTSTGKAPIDYHTTVLPIEQTEIDGRHGVYNLSCP